ncbi:MAG TPA: response regulator [Nitrospiraceae bacterium]|jgi:DNA-binding NtrC family response regulator|nr:response regulator [Nitrospiraceae bacterium]
MDNKGGNKGRVLVVDDEADVRKSLRLILTKAGYDVDEAEDPEAGVAFVKSGKNPVALSAIITDLNMPKINEIIVIPYLRSQFPSCPILVLSGSNKMERAANMFKKAGVEFLAKPINQEQLLGAVSKAVNKG